MSASDLESDSDAAAGTRRPAAALLTGPGNGGQPELIIAVMSLAKASESAERINKYRQGPAAAELSNTKERLQGLNLKHPGIRAGKLGV